MAGGDDWVAGEYSLLRRPSDKAAFALELRGYPCTEAPFCHAAVHSRKAAMQLGSGLVYGCSTNADLRFLWGVRGNGDRATRGKKLWYNPPVWRRRGRPRAVISASDGPFARACWQ